MEMDSSKSVSDEPFFFIYSNFLSFINMVIIIII